MDVKTVYGELYAGIMVARIHGDSCGIWAGEVYAGTCKILSPLALLLPALSPGLHYSNELSSRLLSGRVERCMCIVWHACLLGRQHHVVFPDISFFLVIFFILLLFYYTVRAYLLLPFVVGCVPLTFLFQPDSLPPAFSIRSALSHCVVFSSIFIWPLPYLV